MGEPSRYSDVLLAACTENLQFDRQCEANRARYMMGLLRLAGLQKKALGTILAAFPAVEEGWDRDWMIDLLEALATEGDPQAWEALRDIAATGDERAQDNLATTDEAGLQWIVDHVLPTLEDDRWRIAMWLPDEESEDQTPLLKQLRTLYNEWKAVIAPKRQREAEPERQAGTSLRLLTSGPNRYLAADRFALEATPRQWRAAARRFLRTSDPRELRALVRMFKQRKFPLPMHRLFRNARHPARGWAAMRVIGAQRSRPGRRFALAVIRKRPLPWNALEAIASTLRQGDERIVYAAITSVLGQANTTVHGPILDTVEFMRRYPRGRWQPHAEWIVEHSPCSMCRGSAVDWLIEHATLPAAFLAEAPFDAEPEIREAVAKLGQNTT